MDNLGCAYMKGFGTEINFPQALFWFNKAATEHNDPIALYQLSIMHAKGMGVPTSKIEALKYLFLTNFNGVGISDTDLKS